MCICEVVLYCIANILVNRGIADRGEVIVQFYQHACLQTREMDTQFMLHNRGDVIMVLWGGLLHPLGM